jgi:murein DD-endopeptidase MepM/ murein hydrolase activator NlpD
VSQASNGKTHKGSSKYAIDFSMRRGTPVYAARGGEVAVSIGHNVEGPKARKRAGARKGAPNRVSIRHEDGTVAVYLHLEHEGVTVKVGQTVKTGDLIGYSGSTGKSSGPHLHFAVLAKKGRRGKKRTIPVKFATTVSPATTLERGQRYRPPSTAKLY